MRQIQLLALIGSTKDHSSNQKLVKFLKKLAYSTTDKITSEQIDVQTSSQHSEQVDGPGNRQTNMEKTQNSPNVHWDIFPISGLPYFDPDIDKEPADSQDGFKTDAGNDSIAAPAEHQRVDATAANSPKNDDNNKTEQQSNNSNNNSHTKPLDSDTPLNIPKLSLSRVPTVVQQLRDKIQAADGVLICTPEYVFSLPGILKNALEWLVSSTVLQEKQMALITAAASGEKAKESLELIVRTLGGRFKPDTSILIKGIAGKFDGKGQLADQTIIGTLEKLYQEWIALIVAKIEER